MDKTIALKELIIIPGVGKVVAKTFGIQALIS